MSVRLEERPDSYRVSPLKVFISTITICKEKSYLRNSYSNSAVHARAVQRTVPFMEEPYSENVKFTPVQGLVDPIKTLKEVQDKDLVRQSLGI